MIQRVNGSLAVSRYCFCYCYFCCCYGYCHCYGLPVSKYFSCYLLFLLLLLLWMGHIVIVMIQRVNGSLAVSRYFSCCYCYFCYSYWHCYCHLLFLGIHHAVIVFSLLLLLLSWFSGWMGRSLFQGISHAVVIIAIFVIVIEIVAVSRYLSCCCCYFCYCY